MRDAIVTNEDITRLIRSVREKCQSVVKGPEGKAVVDQVLKEIKTFTELQENLAEKLTEIGIALSVEKNLDALLEMIVVQAMNFTKADGGTIYIMTPDERSIAFKILQTRSLNFRMGGTSGKDIPFPPVQLYKEDGTRNEQQVSAYVALTGKTVNIPDVYEIEGFDFSGTRKFDQGTGYRSKSMLVTALRNHENEIIGVLQLLNAKGDDGETIPFSKKFQELIESLASQAAVAITNTSLIADLQLLLDSFIQVIASAIDEKSPYTGGHIRRVAELTQQIADAISDSEDERWKDFKLNDDEKNELRIAAWMHDIGKITTPEYVVDKATKLETIYDRINTIDARFEVVKRDAEIEFLKIKNEILASRSRTKAKKIAEAEKEYKEKVKQIKEDREFLGVSNIGGEFMEDDKIDRVKKIARYKLKMDTNLQSFLSDSEIYNFSIRRGTLNNEERLIIQDHVKLTIKMLEKLPWPKKLKKVTEYAGGHHEKLDGSGYPYGLKAEDLSMQARIMAVADIFEALTAADRPYKPGKKISECIKILGFMVKDNHIDADIVDFFIKSGLARDYAVRELKDNQLDTFVYDGVEYDCRR